MVYENEITSAPGRLNVGYQADDDRGRVLLRLLSGDVTIRIRTDYNSQPSRADYEDVTVRIVDQSGNSELVYREDMPDTSIREWLTQRGWFRTNDVKERSFSIDFEDSVLSQYRDGTYSNLKPGPATIRVKVSNKPPMETSTTIPLDPNADVRENLSISSPTTRRNGQSVTATADFTNPADHGVTLPFSTSLTVGGDVVDSETASATVAGTLGRGETTRVTLPELTLPPRTYDAAEAVYTLTPTGWADPWIDSVSTVVDISPLSTDAVEITDCAIAPQRVTVPEEVTLTATVTNPTPGRVDADVRFVLAGEETFTKQPVGGDSQRTFETTYATSEPGEATGEVFLDDVVPL